MDFTDSMAHLYGAARSAVAECMNACVNLPENADTPWWENAEEYRALEAAHKAYSAFLCYADESEIRYGTDYDYFIPAAWSEVEQRVTARRYAKYYP